MSKPTALSNIQCLIITGMSGAGKTVAVQSFEDIGYFCVDNLPPALIPKFLELMKETNNTMNKVAFVMDLRGRDFFDELFYSIEQLATVNNVSAKVLFLDAENSVLVRGYKETRRTHPLAPSESPLEGILQERTILEEMKGRAQYLFDTSNMTPRELREKIIADFATDKETVFHVNVMSFGFKHGLPIDADLVFDVRFLPNPHYIDSMRPLTGRQKEVSDYVMKWTETQTFLTKVLDLLEFMIPQYQREGKRQLVIAIGCTGGQHRSVALTEYIGHDLEKDYPVVISHRDMKERKELNT